MKIVNASCVATPGLTITLLNTARSNGFSSDEQGGKGGFRTRAMRSGINRTFLVKIHSKKLNRIYTRTSSFV